MKFFKRLGNIVKKVATSKILTAVAGGLAVVFPVVGVPMTAGLAITGKVLNATKSANPEIAAKAKAMIKNTVQLAKTGDVGAKRAVALMKTQVVAVKGSPKQKAVAKAAISKLLISDRLKKSRAQQVVANFGMTRAGRILNKKTNRHLAAFN